MTQKYNTKISDGKFWSTEDWRKQKCKRQNLAVVLTWYQKYYLFWICSSRHLTSYSTFWFLEHYGNTSVRKDQCKWFLFLHHDATPSCTPALVVIFVKNVKLWTSPCLPDLVHCDFFVSLKLNVSLKESHDYLDTFRAVWKQEWKEFWKMISCNIFGLDVKILIWCQDEYLHFFEQNEPGYFSDHIATVFHNIENFLGFSFLLIYLISMKKVWDLRKKYSQTSVHELNSFLKVVRKLKCL